MARMLSLSSLKLAIVSERAYRNSLTVSIGEESDKIQSRTARGEKVGQLKERLASFGDALEVIDVPDIVTGIFPLDGVDAVIHTASPLPGVTSPEKVLRVRRRLSQIAALLTGILGSYRRFNKCTSPGSSSRHQAIHLHELHSSCLYSRKDSNRPRCVEPIYLLEDIDRPWNRLEPDYYRCGEDRRNSPDVRRFQDPCRACGLGTRF